MSKITDQIKELEFEVAKEMFFIKFPRFTGHYELLLPMFNYWFEKGLDVQEKYAALQKQAQERLLAEKREENSTKIGWIGVDLDGTLAKYDHWRGIEHIGEPIDPMVYRVKQWLAQGREVRIFTARVADTDTNNLIIVQTIDKWCLEHIGVKLPVTNVKDFEMVELWDDRAVQVYPNTGVRVDTDWGL